VFCGQLLRRVPVYTDVTHVNDHSSLASPSAASVHLLTSVYDVGMTSRERLQRREKSVAIMDSEKTTVVIDTEDTSDCHDDDDDEALVCDMRLLGVDVQPTTTSTLPDLVISSTSDATSRRGPTRARLSDATRRKTSSSAIVNSSSSAVTSSAGERSRLTCRPNSRAKRRPRVHAVC